MNEEKFEGYPDRECGEHRTLGGRAWCHDCSEYCYPEGGGCRGCEMPQLRAQINVLTYQRNKLADRVGVDWVEFDTEDWQP